MRYWTYYLIWFLLVYGMRAPWLLGGVVLFVALQRFIPDPGALFRALSRMHSLKQRAEINAADVTARRDLAILYLDLLRPRAALSRLDQALVRAPDDAELRFLRGLALHKSGRHEEALAELVRAVDLDARVRFGQPYRVAGDAMMALRRWDGAVDAYERCIDSNSSDVATHTRLARAQVRAGDREAATRALLEGVRTWHVLPRGMKRRAFAAYLEAQWARAWLLRQPGALAIAAFLLAAGGLAANAAFQWMR